MILNESGKELECGIDEAGRGSFFGRLYVGAVIFPTEVDLDPEIIKDSKKIHSHKKRVEARKYIIDNCLYYGVAYATASEIDRNGIIPSLMSAMHKAISSLPVVPEYLLIDGDRFEPYSLEGCKQIPHQTVVKGDSKYFSVAAASILAKVAHDEHILESLRANPDLDKYGLNKNMGYGTEIHRTAIREYGLSDQHRKTFCEKTLGLRTLPDSNGCYI